MRQSPLSMGEVFVVDDGDLGITVKKTAHYTFCKILDMWPDEQEKDWAYSEFESVTFFNGLGSIALGEWLANRETKIEA